MATYVLIKKWHRMTAESRGGLFKTRCGLWTGNATHVEGIPLDRNTCESCLRLAVRDEENG